MSAVRFAMYGSAVLAALLLGACGRQGAAPVAPAPAASTAATLARAATVPAPAAPATAAAPAIATSAPMAPNPALAPLRVSKITLGTAVTPDHHVVRPTLRFAPTDASIYASVDSEGRSGGATLNARWQYLQGDGQLVSNISQAIATEGPAVTTFQIHNPDLWPEGNYRVEILLDGKPAIQQDFEIRKD